MTRKARPLLIVTLAFLGSSPRCDAQWEATGTGYPYGLTSRVTSMGVEGSLICAGTNLVSSVDAGTSWDWARPHTADSVDIQGMWFDVCFFGNGIGLAAGFFYPENILGILRSPDGGSTWNIVQSLNPGGTELCYLTSISMPDDVNGYAVGTQGRIYRTLDAGQTWLLMPSPGAFDLKAVHFWDEDQGLVLSEEHVFMTDNAGATWDPVLSEGCGGLCILPGGTAFAANDEGLWRSDDHGGSWTLTPVPFTNPGGLWCHGEDVLFIHDFGDGFFRSFNGGQAWERMTGIESAVLGMHFTNGQEVFANDEDDVYKLDDLMTPASPFAVINTSMDSAACGHNFCSAGAYWLDPVWSADWYVDGEIQGSGPNVSFIVTTSGDHDVDLVLSNGTVTDTIWSGLSTTVQPQLAPVSAGTDRVQCFGQSVTLNADNVTNLLWSPAEFLSNPTSPSPTATIEAPTYFVLQRSVGLCAVTDTVFVDVAPQMPEDDWTLMYEQPWPGGWQGDRDIAFTDAMHGLAYVEGSDLLRTADGGSTWTQVAWTPVDPIRDLSMVNPVVGYCLAGTEVHKTLDGWNTHTALPTNASWLDRILFLDEFFGVGLSTGGVHRTVDGGLSWPRVWDGDPWDLCRLGGDTVLVTGLYFAIRSVDAGATWDTVYVDNTVGYGRLTTWSDSVVLVNGELRSEDAGATWERLNTTPEAFTGCALVNADLGFGVYSGQEDVHWKTGNGGHCWQQMEFSIPGQTGANARMGSTVAGVAFILSTTPNPSLQIRIDRLDTYADPMLDFTMDHHILCGGGTVHVWNCSYGWTTVGWYVDDQFWSALDQPPPVELGTLGEHTITLVADLAGTLDTLVRTVVVAEPTIDQAPAIHVMEYFCANQDSVIVAVTTPVNAVTFDWGIFDQESGSYDDIFTQHDDTLYVSHDLYPFGEPFLRFMVRGRDGNGCPGPWSEVMEVPVQGETHVPPIETDYALGDCGIEGQPIAFSVPPHEDFDNYIWSLDPPEAGLLIGNGNQATLTWEGNWSGGMAYVEVQGEGVCGTTISALSSQVSMDLAEVIYFEPDFQVITAEEGALVELTILPSYTWFDEVEWRLHGSVVQDTGTTYVIPFLTASDTGIYSWKADFTLCDHVTVPVAKVMLGPVGVTETLNTPGITVYPVPASDLLSVSSTGIAHMGWSITDAIGKTVLRGRADHTARWTIDVNGWAGGVYSLRWSGDDRSGEARFVVVSP